MSEEIFKNYLDEFRMAAARIFAQKPSLRSVMLGVSQYWADEADDAVHATLIASERAIPVWPHLCAESTYDENEEIENISGEVCSNCGELPWLESWDDNGEAVMAFEAWCHEGGSQEQPEHENALPCVLARKAGDAIEISMIGRIERVHTLLSQFDDSDDHADPMWKDPRALELYDQVCEHALDDGPRRVLADYLLERNQPRGAFIASSLAGSDSDVKVRHDNLLAEHQRSWIYPLGNDVPIATAVFRRGFLAEADVNSNHPEHCGHHVWRTIERLRVLGGDNVLHPNMRALREVGPCDGTWLDALAAATQPWAIEKLEAVIDTERAIDQLGELTTLPALRELTLRGEFAEHAAAAFVRAPWWKQLERLTIIEDADRPIAAWQARHRELGVPWLAITALHMDPTEALGWEIAFGPAGEREATLRGFTPHGSLAALAKLLEHTPGAPVKLVASDYYAPDPRDADLVAVADPITN